MPAVLPLPARARREGKVTWRGTLVNILPAAMRQRHSRKGEKYRQWRATAYGFVNRINAYYFFALEALSCSVAHTGGRVVLPFCCHFEL